MRYRSLAVPAAMIGSLGFAAATHAVDGVIEINQAKALAGGVTPGDGPGFPVVLDRGGSYRLTSNLVVAGDPNANENTNGIEAAPGIEADGDEYDIDLNGFSVIGPVTCTFESSLSCSPNQSGSGRGVTAAGILSLHDGSVRGFASGCIDVGSNGGFYGHRLRNLDVRWCEYGLYAQSAVVENVHAHFNRFKGIWALFSTLRGVMSFRNGTDGFVISVGTLEACQSWFNGGYGIDDQGGSIIRGCVVRQNTLHGLRCVNGAKCGYAEVNFSDNAGGTVLEGVEVGKNVCGNTNTCTPP